MSLVVELQRLADALAETADNAAPIAWPSLAERIAKNLGVKAFEVGILGVSTKWRHLHFLAPEALKNVGFIPLSSNSALAARTARESRPEINNTFSSAKHATVFEGVKIGGGEPGDINSKNYQRSHSVRRQSCWRHPNQPQGSHGRRFRAGFHGGRPWQSFGALPTSGKTVAMRYSRVIHRRVTLEPAFCGPRF